MTHRGEVITGLAVISVAVIVGALVIENNLNNPDMPDGGSTPSDHTPPSSVAVNGTADLLDGQHWQMAGVTVRGQGLHVDYSGMAIVNQDGSPGQANPPVNLYGTRLQTTGGFSVTIGLSGIKDAADFSLSGTPPIVEDEWRAETGTLTTSLSGDTLDVSVSDQTGGNDAEHAQYPISQTGKHVLSIMDKSGQLSFNVDGKEAGKPISDRGIFKAGSVFLGLDAPKNGSSFNVDKLTATPANGGKLLVIDNRDKRIARLPDGFAAAAEKKRPGFLIGAAVAPGPMLDASYLRILGNFNSVTTENVGKFQFIHPLPGNNPNDYNFSDMDAVVALARKSGMKVHGHALVFGEANPEWVQEIARDHPERLKQVMIDHIKVVVGHYRGQVEGWDVGNEPLADYDTPAGRLGLRKNIWYNAMGPEYLAIALRTAHDADPKTGLWLNDFGMESDEDRFNQMLGVVRWLKSQGAPLTGIGFQAHIDDGDTVANDTHIDKNMLRSRIRAVQALGLKVRFSELDVSSVSEYPVFADVTSVCVSEPACVGVTMWGLTDKYSSSADVTSRGIVSPGIGLPWDRYFRPLPPVRGILKALGG